MFDEYQRYKVAAVQAAPVFLDKKATVQKAVRLIDEAASNGAKIIVFPELFIPGYVYWAPDFSVTSAEWVRSWRDLHRNSVEVPSKDTDILCEAARKAGAYLVMGLNERDSFYGGTLYNSILFIDSQGRIMGVHRKLVPTHHEKLYHGVGDGSTLRVFDTELGRIGGLICGEHVLPHVRYSLIVKGEQIHCALWPGWPGWPEYNSKALVDCSCRQHAREGQVFVIVACNYITKDMIPDSFPFKEKARWDSYGGSGIIGPQGQYLAGPVYDQETIVYGEINTGMIPLAKSTMDTTGHYARWDVVSLNINEEAYPPFSPMKPLDRTTGVDGLREPKAVPEALRGEGEDHNYQELKQAIADLKAQVEALSRSLGT